MARVNHKITPFIRNRTFQITAGLCWYCGLEAETVDHGHPLSRGGSKSSHNLYPSCKRCNHKKEDYTIEEFREYVFHKYMGTNLHSQALCPLKQQVSKNKQFFGEEHGYHTPEKKYMREKRKYMNDPKAGYYSLAEKMSWSTE